MFFWIYERPAWEVASIFALTFMLVTWVATLVCRRLLHDWFHTEHRANEMVGFVLSSYSVLYALLVGLIAIAAYQNITNISDIIAREASGLGAIYRYLGSYPQPARSRMRSGLEEYVRYEIEREWPQLRRGVVPAEGSHRLAEVLDDVMRFPPQNRRQEIIHTEVQHQIDTFLELHTERLDSVSGGIPAVLWWVVGIGALITLVLVAMLTMEIHVHLILGAALSSFLGALIFLIAVLDHPYRGDTVDAGPFEEVYRSIMLPNDAVDRSMADLISAAGRLGPPRIDGTVPIAGQPAPGLYFGTHAVNNTTDLVDGIAQRHGGVASIFVKSGNDFVRVSTNTLTPQRTRATGTLLDPEGPAIQRIRKGQAYYGNAMAVGKYYMTGYEPMTDAKGDIIGIYCTAYLDDDSGATAQKTAAAPPRK